MSKILKLQSVNKLIPTYHGYKNRFKFNIHVQQKHRS